MIPPSKPFRMSVCCDPKQALVEAAGEFDMSSLHVFDTGLAAAFHQDVQQIGLDMSGVSFIDSSGVRAVLIAQDAARSREATLQITAASPHVVRVMEIAGLAALLPT